MNLSSLLADIKNELVKIKASPLIAQIEVAAQKIASNATAAEIEAAIQEAVTLFKQLEPPIVSALSAALPQYAGLFALLNQVDAVVPA